MTDYARIENYTAKDALLTGDPDKLIVGAELQAELDAIVVAVASKYDSGDIASQAQAEAGVSNTVLITPLRMSQHLAGAGGASGAGMVGDIITLADPNADRILFWDDSAGAVALLTVSTGLTISGTTLTTNDAAINHNALLNYDANRHIDHTAVSISTGSGLTGGGTIAATRTLSLDLVGLTTDNVFDTSVDYIPYYDAGEGANNKVLMSSLVGVALGDGSWYLSGAQAMGSGSEATILYNTAEYTNTLSRGTFSTSTGIYTAGASGARVEVAVSGYITSLNAAATFTLSVYQNAVLKCSQQMRNDADHTAGVASLGFSITLNLAASDTVKVTIVTSAASSAAATHNRLSIVELA